MNLPSPPVITALPTDALPTDLPNGTAEHRTENIWLDWHDRRKARQRVTSDAGTELFLSLPRGTILPDGQLLYCDSHRQVVVRAKPEPLIAITSSSVQESCRVAHHLGNWHRPMQIDPDGTLWVECDRPVVEWLERRNIPFQALASPFEPNSIAHHH